MTITIKYFASLADIRGSEEETITLTEPCTAESLYDILQKQHNFSFDISNLRVAVNHEYKPFSTHLHDGDIVVFIPPVSGG